MCGKASLQEPEREKTISTEGICRAFKEKVHLISHLIPTSTRFFYSHSSDFWHISRERSESDDDSDSHYDRRKDKRKGLILTILLYDSMHVRIMDEVGS